VNTFDSNCATAATAPPDNRKHVNYVQGMVLGVDDMVQDFAYHQNQRQWLARDTIGYGTLNGLLVEAIMRDPSKGVEISVSCGSALSRRGRLIRVAPQQCAAINAWLDLPDTRQKIKNLGNNFTVYVVLCFRDCQVDPLPVPGEPCRCADQAVAPSRVLDDFRLELRLDPAAQREEDALRDFVAWLRQVPVADFTGGLISVNDLEKILHDAAVAAAKDDLEHRHLPSAYLPTVSDMASPLESPLSELASPPDDLCTFLRTAFRLWVTELQPLWHAQWAERTGGGCGCHGDEKTTLKDAEECLLLAALNITLTGGHVASVNDVRVDDSQRPFVVHLRMLQEMLLCGLTLLFPSSAFSALL
jgi:hypothetical protein